MPDKHANGAEKALAEMRNLKQDRGADEPRENGTAPESQPETDSDPQRDEATGRDVEPITDQYAGNASGGGAPTSTTLKRAWRQSYPGIAAILFLTLLINVFKLAVPLYIFQILDRVVSSRSVETLIMLTVIVLAAVLANAVAEFVRRWSLIKWGAWIEQRFGRRLLLSGLSADPEAQRRPSDLLRDLSSLRQFLASSAAIAWLDVVYVPAFVLIVYLISPTIALVVVIAMLVVLVLGISNEALSRGSRSAATLATRERADWFTAAERNPEVIGSFSVADNIARQWERSSSSRLKENLSTRMVSLATTDSMRLVESCQRIASYGLGIWFVLQGSLTIGGVIAAAILGRIATGTFRRAMSSWRNLASAQSAYTRVKKGLGDEEFKRQLTSSRAAGLPLQLDDVGHRYPEQSTALFRHVSLSLEPGEMLAIIGPSGAGKSTMARILTGRIPPRSGMVRLGDADITRFPPNELASRVGYLSQHAQLFRGTVRDNISGLADGIDDSELIAAAELVGIHRKIVSLPDGYETQINDRNTFFSAGECKQIALAGVICAKPDLLVLDDPEAFLDKTGQSALSQALVSCKADGMIVVVTTQSMELGRISDKAIVLKRNGKPVICQDREEILNLRRQSKRSRPRIISSNDKNEPEK